MKKFQKWLFMGVIRYNRMTTIQFFYLHKYIFDLTENAIFFAEVEFY